MSAGDVRAVLDRLTQANVTVWLDDGWGIDALVGEQTRAHADLDSVIAREDLDRAREALHPLGYGHALDERPGLPARLVLRAEDGRQLDLHPVLFDECGNGWQELEEGGWCLYPGDGLLGTGSIAGLAVRCCTAELQLSHHLGYPLKAIDRHDLDLLAARTGVAVPPNVGRPGTPA